MSSGGVPGWTVLELTNGRIRMTNEDGYELYVYSDLSGFMKTPEGGYVPFRDFRVLVDAAEMIKQTMTSVYGGHK